MRTLVVFESMYGNTLDLAEAVADGRDNKLYAGEVERARRWGRAVAEEAARHSGRLTAT